MTMGIGIGNVSELVEVNYVTSPISTPNNTSRHNSFNNKNENTKNTRIVTKIQICWSFISFVLTVGDVTVIIYLSYLHFHHSADLVAWIMLMPILLNFIGIFTFLSNENERKEMESLGCHRFKNLMFFPVVGPAFSALRLFVYTIQEPNAEHTERLESLLTRMKQYESFFRAAPEAFIQITFRIITWSATKKYVAEDYWTTVCIALCLLTLAESNMYGSVNSYYHMFHYESTQDAWKINHIPMKWRVGLFIFTYYSIGCRIFADAIFKATACFYFEDESFGEVIIITFLIQFLSRAGLYAFINSIISKRRRLIIDDEGVYGAFTYSWKSLFMSFDYQSHTKCIFFWFYIETFLMIFGSYIVIYFKQIDLSDKFIYHLYSITALGGMAIAISLKTLLSYRWKKRNENKISTRL